MRKKLKERCSLENQRNFKPNEPNKAKNRYNRSCFFSQAGILTSEEELEYLSSISKLAARNK